MLVPTVTDRIDAEMIAQAGEKLKLIANFGNGVDNIDVDAASKRGIIVTNTPGVLTEDTADMTMALILSVPRRLAEGAARAARRAEMERLVADLDARPPDRRQAPRHRRHGADRHGGGAAGARLRAFHPLPQPPPGRGAGRRRSWRRPIGTASTRCSPAIDIVSVNSPATPATFHLLSRAG